MSPYPRASEAAARFAWLSRQFKKLRDAAIIDARDYGIGQGRMRVFIRACAAG